MKYLKSFKEKYAEKVKEEINKTSYKEQKEEIKKLEPITIEELMGIKLVE